MKTKVQENGAPQEIESEYSPVEELRRLRTQLLESRFRERKLRNKLAVLAEDNADKASIIANQNARLKDLDGQNQRAISEVAALARSITLLEDERDEAQKELRSLKADLDARRAKLVVSSGEKLGEHVEIRALQDVGAKLLRKREDAVHENVALSELLRVAEQRELRCRKDLSRLQSQWQAYAKWLSIYIPEIYDVGRIRPGSSQLDELQRRVKASKLFDQAWYKQSYPDVGEFAFGAAEHFILHGLFEGRTPTCDIAVVPDVNESEARDAD